MLSTNNSNTQKSTIFRNLLTDLTACCPNLSANAALVERRMEQRLPVKLFVEDYYLDNKLDLTGFTRITKDDVTGNSSIPTVVVSDRTDFDGCDKLIHVVPKKSVLGISCPADVSYEEVQTAFALFMSINHLSWGSIESLASIDLNQDQANIQYLAKTLQAKTNFFSKDQLAKTDINYQASPDLKQATGVGNIASSAANLASGQVVFIPQFNSKKVSLAICHQ